MPLSSFRRCSFIWRRRLLICAPHLCATPPTFEAHSDKVDGRPCLHQRLRRTIPTGNESRACSTFSLIIRLKSVERAHIDSHCAGCRNKHFSHASRSPLRVVIDLFRLFALSLIIRLVEDSSEVFVGPGSLSNPIIRVLLVRSADATARSNLRSIAPFLPPCYHPSRMPKSRPQLPSFVWAC